jgi:FixJ family two-component response regulator
MKEGAADLIEKPFSNEDLLARVRAALEKDSRRGELYAKLERLSPRESEVANLMAAGLSTKAIASQLGSSAHTVRNQRTSIFRKMDVQSVVELVRIMNNPDAVGTTEHA